MTCEDARKKLMAHWLTLADEAMASADSELQAGRGRFAINRCYYACFYGASAVLLKEGRTFTRHAGVREGVHRDLVRAGRMMPRLGRIYDELFAARHEADYGLLVRVEQERATEAISRAREFVAEMKRLIAD